MCSWRQSGFTLVEVAMVLAVVGLVIGGVMKSQEMITNAKLKRIERDRTGLSTAIFSYQDRYRQLPGDDYEASARFSIYTDGINDPTPAQIDGDGDGIITGNWVSVPTTESSNLWKHLRASGLIPGGGDNETQPTNTYGGLIGVRDSSLQIAGHVMIFGSIKGPVAHIIETRIDDGDPSSGRVQSDLTEALMNGSAASSAGAIYLDEIRYYMAFNL